MLKGGSKNYHRQVHSLFGEMRFVIFRFLFGSKCQFAQS